MKGLKKAALLFICVLSCSIFALGLTGCGKKPAIFQDNPADDIDNYVEYVAAAKNDGLTPLLYGEWHDTVETIANATVSAYTVWNNEGTDPSDDVNSFIIAIQKKGVRANAELKSKTINLSKTNIANGVITVCYSDGSSVTPAIDLGENFKDRNSVNVELTDSQILHFTFGEKNVYVDIYVSSVPVSECSSHRYEKNEVFAHTSDAKDNGGAYGISYSDCSVCGALKVELTTGHKLEETVKEPTCTEEGYSTYVCKQCGYEGVHTDITEKIAHDEEEHIVDPTCSDDGYTYYTCKNCDYKSEHTNITAKLEHKMTTVTRLAHEDKRNECEDGKIEVTYCELCGYIRKVIPLPKEGHHSIEWKVDKEPSNKNPGSLIGFCYKCLKEDVKYDLPFFNPLDNNGAPYEWELMSYEEWNCSKDLDVHYWITVDGQRFDFYNGIYPHKNHTLKNKFNEDKGGELFPVRNSDGEFIVYTYAKDEIVSGDRGIKLFYNAPLTCRDEGEDALFTCPVCQQDVRIKVRTYHTPGDNEVEYNSDFDCTDERSSTFDCAECGEKNVHGPIGHDYKINSIKELGGGECEIEIACAREKSDFNITIKSRNVERLNNEFKCVAQARYSVSLAQTANECDYKLKKANSEFVDNGCAFVDEYGRVFIGEKTLLFTENVKPHMFNGKDIGDPLNACLPIGNGAHAFGNEPPACSEKSVSGYFECDVCKQIIQTNVYAAHNFQEINERIEPTCTESGYWKKTDICAVCGLTRVEDGNIDALGHDFVYGDDDIEVDGQYYRIEYLKLHCQRENCGLSIEVCKDGISDFPHIAYENIYDSKNNPTGIYERIAIEGSESTCTAEGECYYAFNYKFSVDDREYIITIKFKGPDLKKPHVPYENGLVIEWEMDIQGTVYVYRAILCEKCNEIIEVVYKERKDSI